ncbi:MAG: C25 family cysteine peptidase [Saprospiraceae bacterium]|nr:C25 family cysteine peptidase [Saprospiraceae bacterium]MDW8482719.1 C25 family cysteine peptidase [Saprospiraceae bacterium]
MRHIFLMFLNWLSIFSAAAQTTSPDALRVLSNTDTAIVLRWETPELNFKKVVTPKGEAIVPFFSGGKPLLRRGMPDVPKYPVAVRISPANAWTIAEVEGQYEDFFEVEVAPSKGNLLRHQHPSAVPYVYGSVYNEDAFFPGTLAELKEPFVLRDARGQALWLYPVQYHPTRRILRVYRTLTIRLTQSSKPGFNECTSCMVAPSRAFLALQQRLFVNGPAKSIVERQKAETPEKMLIITPLAFLPELDTFIAWKRQRGLSVEVVTTDEIGSNKADAIFTFVKQYYTEHGITYLLLVGDDAAIEPLMRPYIEGRRYACDNCFGYLSGDDHILDVFVGRLHATTPQQVRLMVRRILEYEKTPLLDPQNDWMSAGMAVASDEGQHYGDDDQADWEHGNEWKAKHLVDGYTWYWEFYDGSYGAFSPTPGHPTADKEGNPLPNDLREAIRQRGVSLFNYTGHGWEEGLVTGNFDINIVRTLDNPGRYPILIAVGCSPGDFTNDAECFGEAWQRAGHTTTGQPWGGIAGFFSSVLQSWAPPMEAQDAMNQYLVDADGITLHPTLGAMAAAGYASMIAAYGWEGEEMADFWNPFVDPTTVPRTRFPKSIVAQHPDTLEWEATALSVTCPVEGALAALYAQDQVIAIARVSNGMARLVFDPLTLTGPLTLTLTQFNYLPYQKQLEVRLPSGAFIAIAAVRFTDAGVGGNGNGHLEYGESGEVCAILRNVGSHPSSPLSVRIHTSSPYIQWISSSTTLPSLEAGGEVEHCFRFVVRQDVPHGSRADFRLSVSDNAQVETSRQVHTWLYAPRLEFSGWSLSAAAGYHARRLESGEVGRLYLHLRNYGGSPSPLGTVKWRSTHPHLKGLSPAAVPSIPPGGMATVLLDVEASMDAPKSTWVFPEVEIAAGAYRHTFSVGPFVINPIVETFESGNFQRFAWQRSGNRLWHISTQTPYEGDFCIQAGGHSAHQQSTLKLSTSILADGWISFVYRLSTPNVDDSLFFALDNVRLWSAGGNQETWKEALFPITAGFHTLTWTFQKGESNQTRHAAFLDEIILPPLDGYVSVTDLTRSSGALSVWPNPASQWLWIELPHPVEGLLELWNLASLCIHRQLIHNAKALNLSVEHLPPGVYLLRLVTAKEEFGARFVKH